MDEYDVAVLLWTKKTEFGRLVKEGDHIILKAFNETKSRSYVYPPARILKKQVIDEIVYLYHDCSDFDYRLPWGRFRAAVKTV
jgi:hypothetical protein